MKTNKLKKCLSLLLIVLSMLSLKGQDFDCDLIFWETVKDTLDQDGNPAIVIRLSTENNPNNTGYTTFMILNEQGDTMVEKTGFDHFLPAVEAVGDPVKEYFLKLKPPFTEIGDDFNGCLFTTFPICNFKLAVSLSAEDIESFDSKSIEIYPNPFNAIIHIRAYSMESERVEIYNSWGVQIDTRKILIGQDLNLDTNDWPSGFYFLKTNRSISKLVKL